MVFIEKINEYKDNIEALQAIDSMEVYRWMISLGQKLSDDPLSMDGRLPKNQVSYCQFELYVDWEDDRFKAYSDALIAGGYAYMLLDIFNASRLDEARLITTDHFRAIKMDELLSMNRTNGFYQMIEMMQTRLPAA
jgi:sulfur transfer protein SufE